MPDSILPAFARPVYAELRKLFRVADVQHATSVALHVYRIVHWIGDDHRSRGAAIIQVRNPADIIPGFRIVWHSSAPRHRLRPGVVRRQAQLDVSAVALQQTL